MNDIEILLIGFLIGFVIEDLIRFVRHSWKNKQEFWDNLTN